MDIFSWAYKRGIRDIRKKIEKAIKEKRLVFLGDNHVLYIDKQGRKQSLNFYQATQTFIDLGGWSKNMVTLGITNQDIVNILVEEYSKQKREGK
jgi:uncharacterized hydantoinase/oxoprolinase family protein